MLLENKVALITGAARGIGKQIALAFAREGCNIAFTDLEINDQAEETVAELEACGVKVKAYASNAADFDAAHQVVEQVIADFGRIDILVNNAGITRDTLLMRMTEQQWDQVINVNLKSAFNFTHAVTPAMMKQRSGSIISLSSVVGINGNAGQANYAASKAGIIALTKSVAKELGARGIRANAILPGMVETKLINSGTYTDEDKQNDLALYPLGRYGRPEDIARAMVFLLSDASAWMTGTELIVDGGRCLK